MPKELIFGRDHPYGEDDPRQSVVEVRWDSESGYFQMATKERTSEVFVPGDELPNGCIPAQYGWYIELDRRGINDLIRTLRRARDQAYGKDE